MKNYIENIKADAPEHMRMTIEDTSDLEQRAELFALEKKWADNSSVNIFDVTGSCHPDYIGLSWLEMLDKGKRMPLNIKLLQENPGYYFQNTQKSPTMYYAKIGKDLFVTSDGNHRTCLAKVLFYYEQRTDLHGVVVEEIIKDYELERAFKQLSETPEIQRAGVRIEVLSKHVSRTDASGWKSDRYVPVISARNKNFHKIELNASETLDFLTELKSGHFTRLFRHNRYAKFIKG